MAFSSSIEQYIVASAYWNIKMQDAAKRWINAMCLGHKSVISGPAAFIAFKHPSFPSQFQPTLVTAKQIFLQVLLFSGLWVTHIHTFALGMAIGVHVYCEHFFWQDERGNLKLTVGFKLVYILCICEHYLEMCNTHSFGREYVLRVSLDVCLVCESVPDTPPYILKQPHSSAVGWEGYYSRIWTKCVVCVCILWRRPQDEKRYRLGEGLVFM